MFRTFEGTLGAWSSKQGIYDSDQKREFSANEIRSRSFPLPSMRSEQYSSLR